MSSPNEQLGGEPTTGAGKRHRKQPLPPELQRRRRKLLGFSAPLVLTGLVIASLLLGMWGGNLLGTRAYDEGGFEQAAAQYEHPAPLNSSTDPWNRLIEPWRAPYNSGTATFHTGDYFGAVESLRTALDLVPEAEEDDEGQLDPESPECQVRTNLSLSIEAMGDDAAEDGDTDMAIAHYDEAQYVISTCTDEPDNEESQDRQQEKEESQDDEPSEEPSDEPSEEPTEEPSDEPSGQPSEEPTDEPSEQPSEEPTEEPDSKQEELEQRNQDTERQRQQEEERDSGGYGGGQNW